MNQMQKLNGLREYIHIYIYIFHMRVKELFRIN